MAKNNRLGKGLGAIFGEDMASVLEDIQSGANESVGTRTRIPVKEIRTNPYQPRRHFDEEKLNELAESIKQHGLFTPVLVREVERGYELIAGERRLRAVKIAELELIDAIVVDFNDQQMMEIALIENVQREDLSVIEEALGYKMLIDRLELTQEDVAKRVNKSRSHITNLLRLLRLPETVQKMVQDQRLTMGHVRPLLSLEDNEAIEEMAQMIQRKKLSVRDVERLIQDRDKPESKKPEKEENKDYRYAKRLFEDRLQTRVDISAGKVIIQFSDDDDLNRLLEVLDLLED